MVSGVGVGVGVGTGVGDGVDAGAGEASSGAMTGSALAVGISGESSRSFYGDGKYAAQQQEADQLKYLFSFQNLGKKRIYMDALRRIMFLKQVSYNWYLFRDITHSKAQNGTQR